jgi:hypothetical protein
MKMDEGSEDSGTVVSGNITVARYMSWASLASRSPAPFSAGREVGRGVNQVVGRDSRGVRGTSPSPSALASPPGVPPSVSHTEVDALRKENARLVARLAQFEKSTPTPTTSSVGVRDKTELASVLPVLPRIPIRHRRNSLIKLTNWQELLVELKLSPLRP